MKGYRFYLEHETPQHKQRGEHEGAVIATFEETRIESLRVTGKIEAFCSVFARPNSPVNFASVSPDYLHENCKRISEEQAREIHPELFERLES